MDSKKLLVITALAIERGVLAVAPYPNCLLNKPNNLP